MTAGRVRVLAAAALLAVSVSACATTVDGTGQRVTPAPSTNPLPTGPAEPAVPEGRFSCPRVAYPDAHLSFNCVVGGLAVSAKNPVWPVSLRKTVESETGWVVEEGAGNWGDPGSDSPSAIAKLVRTHMVDAGQYGESPTLKTAQDAKTTIGGVRAHVLQTTITLNPAWAKQRGTAVKTERLWIVVLAVSAHDTALWYVSIPNLASRLWARVPATIRSIHAG